jgi:hypothetical protein
MEKLLNFFMIIAWIGAIFSTIATLLCLYKSMTYNGSKEQLFDSFQGKQATWPMGKWIVASIICWAFIISFK